MTVKEKRFMRPRIVLTLFIAAIALVATGVAESPSANDLFQEAWRFQESKGDLVKAIDLYKTLVDRYPNAAVTPKALIEMAECYEKLGRPAAADVYRQVVNRYAASGAPAASARARLAALDQKGGPVAAVRRVWDGSSGAEGGVSPDGRLITYVNWDDGTGALAVHEVSSGKGRNVTDRVPGTPGSPDEEAESSRFSPDGRSIAYTWNLTKPEWRPELRLIPLQGGPFRILDANAEKAGQIRVWGWTSDNRTILISKSTEAPGSGPSQPRRTATLLLIPADGGPAKQIKRFAMGEEPDHFAISPDGRYVAYDFPAAAGRPERDLFLLSVKDGEVTALRHPSDDRMLSWLPDGTAIFLNSDRAGTYGVWTMSVSNGQTTAAATLVKPDTGLISALGFTKKGDFFYETADRIDDVSIATIDPLTAKQINAPTRLEGRYVGGKLQGVWSPDGTRIAYFQDVRLSGARTSATADRRLAIQTLSTGSVDLFDLQLPGLGYPTWSRDGRSVIIQGTDMEGRQGLFQIDLETRAKVLLATSKEATEPRRITPATTPDGRSVFFHLVYPSSKMLELRDEGGIASRELASGAEKVVIPGRVTAFAVSPDGRWIAKTSTRNTMSEHTLTIIPTSGGAPKALAAGVADWKLRGPVAWSPDGRFVYVVRADLPGNEEIFQVPVDGSAPRPTGIFWRGLNGRLDVHPDGRRIAVSNAGAKPETWMLSDIKK